MSFVGTVVSVLVSGNYYNGGGVSDINALRPVHNIQFWIKL